MDLAIEINEKTKELSYAIKMMERYAREIAQNEKDYKIALRQEALKLRSSNMAVTLIDKVVYGVPEVADKRFKRDVAVAMYETAKENINVLKTNIRILETQYKIEYGEK